MGKSQVQVRFAPALQRHVPCPEQFVAAGSLAAVLAQAFTAAPALRHYVLDDQGHIRKHVAVFINDVLWQQREDLTRALSTGDRVDVVQALSGG